MPLRADHYLWSAVKPVPTIEELKDTSSWEKVLTLPYDEIAPFVIGHISSISIPMMLVWLTAIASLFLSVWYWPGLVFPSEDPRVLAGLTVGLLIIPILLVPLHEGSHILPFWLAGARDIRYGVNLRQGIIYVTAHRFVVTGRVFAIIALIPFVIITLILGILILISPLWWKWVLSMTLFVHTTMCTGDAALTGFMNSFGKRSVCTWDDAELKEAYFYASVETV